MKSNQTEIPTHEYLKRNLREMPYFRSILRAVEGSFYQRFDLSGKILDIGSGDGHFAEVSYEKPLDVGIDPWLDFNAHHARYHGHTHLVRGEGALMPFPDNTFDTLISNSVLEHIEFIQPVLNDAGRVIKKDGLFLFCVPNSRAFEELSIAKFLEKNKLPKLAQAYRNWFVKISLTHNADMPEVWQKRLDLADFELETWWHYFPPKALHALEWGHYFGFPSAIIHFLTGRWLLSSSDWNLSLTEKYCSQFIDNNACYDGTYTFFVARKR